MDSVLQDDSLEVRGYNSYSPLTPPALAGVFLEVLEDVRAALDLKMTIVV